MVAIGKQYSVKEEGSPPKGVELAVSEQRKTII